MRSKLFIVVLFNLFCFHESFAQKKNVYFLKNSGVEVKLLDSADFIRIVSEPDSGSTLYNVVEYYKNNAIKLQGKSSRIDPPTFEGQRMTYYPSGKKQEYAYFKAGAKEGDAYRYYKNGKLYEHKQYLLTGRTIPGSDFGGDELILDQNDSTGRATVTDGTGYYTGYNDDLTVVHEEGKVITGLRDGLWKGRYDDKDKTKTFIETYQKGNLLSGTATEGDNINYSYTKRMINPQFPGGLPAFGVFLGNNIDYPYSARTRGIEGMVVLSFVVQRDGSLTDYKVLRSPDDALSKEALRVLKRSPHWIPGMAYGQKVRVSFTVPVNFALDGKPQ